MIPRELEDLLPDVARFVSLLLQRHSAVESPLDCVGEARPPAPATEGQPVSYPSEFFERLLRCSEVFTRKQWDVLVLYYRDGHSEERVSEELGISRSAVNQRRTRALERFKESESRRIGREYETRRKYLTE